MPTFIVYGTAAVGVFKEIEADTAEQARGKAAGLGMPSVCHQCSRGGQSHKDSWQLSDGIRSDAIEVTEVEGG